MNAQRSSVRSSSRNRNRTEVEDEDKMEEVDKTPMSIQDGKISKTEPDFNDMKEQLYKEKLVAIKLDIEQIKSGNFDPIKDQLSVLEGIRNERVSQSESAKQTQIKAVTAIFDAEIQAAEDEFEADRQEVVERMLASLTEKQKRLEEHKDKDFSNILDDGPERIQTRKMRRRGDMTTGAGDAKPAGGGGGKKKRDPMQQGYLSLQLNRTITDDEVQDDLDAIKKGISSTRGVVRSTWADQNALFDVRFDKGFLFYQNQVFERGDRVIIELGGHREKGEISTISSAEVSIRTNDQKKARIYLSQLKNGRAFILPGPAAETSSEDEMMDLE